MYPFSVSIVVTNLPFTCIGKFICVSTSRLVSTVGTWIEISVDGYSGWILTTAVWGSLRD